MHEGTCNKCHSGKMIVIGILILVWNGYISGNFLAQDWPTFIGALLILKGILCMAKPTCGHSDATSAKKKK